MKNSDIFELIGEADEKYVADAAKPIKKKRPTKRMFLIPAVAVLLASAIIFGFMMLPGSRPNPPAPGSNEIPETTAAGESPDVIQTTNTPSGTEKPVGTGSAVTTRPALTNKIPIYSQPTFNPVAPDVADKLAPYALLSALYPETAQYVDYFEDKEGHEKWDADKKALNKLYYSLENRPTEFYGKIIAQYLSGLGNDNAVLSPVNIYMALAMLAETTDGNSRAQILNLLGVNSIEELRVQAVAVWRAHYCKDGTDSSTLASSIWMDNGISYNEDTLKRLTETYYASSFYGEMGSDGYNEALRAWLNEQTGGMLADQIEELEMNSNTVLAIATTVLFKAKWESEFDAKKNTQNVFHGADGDVMGTFMNQKMDGTDYIIGDKFTSVNSKFSSGGGMRFILPNEGVSIDELLRDPNALGFITSGSYGVECRNVEVNLSLPKFDVSSDINLIDGLKELGVTDVFDENVSDFSPLTDVPYIYVNNAQHGARVVIDEEGCVASAYTILDMEGGSMPPEETVDFVLDRPFIFVITSDVGAPLFVGVVNQLK